MLCLEIRVQGQGFHLHDLITFKSTQYMLQKVRWTLTEGIRTIREAKETYADFAANHFLPNGCCIAWFHHDRRLTFQNEENFFLSTGSRYNSILVTFWRSLAEHRKKASVKPAIRKKLEFLTFARTCFCLLMQICYMDQSLIRLFMQICSKDPDLV